MCWAHINALPCKEAQTSPQLGSGHLGARVSPPPCMQLRPTSNRAAAKAHGARGWAYVCLQRSAGVWGQRVCVAYASGFLCSMGSIYTRSFNSFFCPLSEVYQWALQQADGVGSRSSHRFMQFKCVVELLSKPLTVSTDRSAARSESVFPTLRLRSLRLFPKGALPRAMSHWQAGQHPPKTCEVRAE